MPLGEARGPLWGVFLAHLGWLSERGRAVAKEPSQPSSRPFVSAVVAVVVAVASVAAPPPAAPAANFIAGISQRTPQQQNTNRQNLGLTLFGYFEKRGERRRGGGVDKEDRGGKQ